MTFQNIHPQLYEYSRLRVACCSLINLATVDYVLCTILYIEVSFQVIVNMIYKFGLFVNYLLEKIILYSGIACNRYTLYRIRVEKR